MDLNALLAARESDGASGENLEYDFDFMELQRVATPGEERQAGNEIIAGADPDFADVATRAVAILERAHDLRVAVMLAGAMLNTDGIAGFAEALTYIRRCLEEHWETCHPLLDADDDNDPTMRINAMVGLAGTVATPGIMLKYLRRAPLTRSRTFGRLSLRDIQIGLGETPAQDGEDGKLDKAVIDAAFSDTPAEALTALLGAARQVLADLKAIEAVFSDRTPGQGPDLIEARKIVQQMVRRLADHVASDPSSEDAGAQAEDQDAQDYGTAKPGLQRGGSGLSGAVDTAGDAKATLDRVIAYFKRNEPSSPVPIILERAKRLVGADFLTIMKDLAPDGLDSVMNIGGIKPDEAD